MNADFVIGVSDQVSDNLNLVFNTIVGRKYLADRVGMAQESIAALSDLSLSSIANIVVAIEYAKYMDLGSDDAVLTVATDGAQMYETELAGAEKRSGGGGFGTLQAAEILLGQDQKTSRVTGGAAIMMGYRLGHLILRGWCGR